MIQSSKELFHIIDQQVRDSFFLQRIEYYSRVVDTIWGRNSVQHARKLQQSEINILVEQGNLCGTWENIYVAPEFSPDSIFNSRFIGSCYIGVFHPDFHNSYTDDNHPLGIYDSCIENSIILDNALIFGNSYIKKCLLAEEVYIFNSCISGNEGMFGLGAQCDPGLETGERKMALYPDLTWEIAYFYCEHLDDVTIREQYEKRLEEYKRKIDSVGCTIIDNNAVLRGCLDISDVYIGPCSRILGAMEIAHTSILSTEIRPVSIGPGVICRNSMLYEGSEVDSGAVVENCGVFQFCSINKHAKASNSLLGPDMSFSEGEITASFVGPFVGFHHQGLLISAYWPDGKGNVGYGANVGSNHTSRLPDQEIWPGEGMFFGLGCCVKFPANFRNAPYTIIATGVITLPQKMEFPFSCIVSQEKPQSTIPSGYNRLIPGWCLYKNMYMCIRGSYKNKKRSNVEQEEDFNEVFRQPVMEKVRKARNTLQQFFRSEKAELNDGIFTDSHLPELGKNFMHKKDLVLAVDWYTFILQYYCCRKVFSANQELLKKNSNVLSIIQDDPFISKLFLEIFESDGPLLLYAEKYGEILSMIEELTITSKERDALRGEGIIDNYAATHPPASDDPVIIDLQLKNEEERKKIKDLVL